MSQLEAEVRDARELAQELVERLYSKEMFEYLGEHICDWATDEILKFAASHTAQESRGEVVAEFQSLGCLVTPRMVGFKCTPGVAHVVDTWADGKGDVPVVVTITLPPVPQTVNVEEEG